MAADNGGDNSDTKELEEALVALIEHRTKEVEQLRMLLVDYQSQLHEAEKKLEETQLKLTSVRNRRCASTIEDAEEDCKIVKTKRKPVLVIPKVSPIPNSVNISKCLANQMPARGIKRKNEDVEDKDLIKIVSSCSSPCNINCEASRYIPSQHKRKLRSLVLCPTNDQLFVTSALDGIVNLWEIQDKGSHANFISSINAASVKQRRWPEDIAWHPHRDSLVCVYSADCGDSQLAILNLNNKGEEVMFLEDKPHVKGVINSVMFMPWSDTCFATCGCDHAVVLWTEKRNFWTSKVLHKSLHSSTVMGVAGMHQKHTLISVGLDKRIIGFDLESQVADYKHLIDSKCLSVVPNPRDFNLFMVQTGATQRQLRLFDTRAKGSQVHEFGWYQESQSALINQAWSPDGLRLTSGSADPTIHIFDIRFNGKQPSRSIEAHQKRVFKAAWHASFPLLVSISSDLNIGFHDLSS